MERGFNTPMIAHGPGKRFHPRRQTRDEPARLQAGFVGAFLPLAVDPANTAQVLPIGVTLCQLVGHAHNIIDPCLDTAMPLVLRAITVMFHACEVVVEAYRECG